MPRKRVEILSFDGCPNSQAAEELVGRVLTGLEIETEVALIRVEDADAAERLRFLGSPTIRVAGEDVEPGVSARTDYTLACRIYAAEGGLSNLPNEDWVRAALAGRDT